MLQQFSNWLVTDVFRLEPGSHLADSASYFIYDSIKIIFLLVVITYFMSVVRHYLPIEKLRDFLLRHKLYGFDYLLASLFGAVTPFCTCSSIPLFIGFIGAGIPLGVTFAFLITSPLINEIAVAMFIGLFGWKVTAMYVTAGLTIGMVGGYLISRLKLERYVEGYITRIEKKEEHESVQKQKPFSVGVLQDALRESWSITRKVAPYVLLGVGVGAAIHGYVPEGLFEKYVGEGNIFAVPLAVVLAVPLYASAHSVFPVVDSLVTKGVPLGTALAFMMATVGLSLPEALILRRAIKMPLLLTFFGIVTVGIVLIGYIFNLVL